MARDVPTIAATSTLAMVRTSEARGVSASDVLRAVGVDRAQLEAPDARIPAPDVLSIWNALRERTGDPWLQLVAPAALPWGAYRIFDYLLGASATIGDGLQHFARFFGLIAQGVSLDIEKLRDSHAMTLTMESGAPVPAVYVDYVFAALVSRIRMRIRPALRVHALELRASAPVSCARYTEVFEAPVKFGATCDRLHFSFAEWKAPTEMADATLAQLLEEHARILADRVRRAPNGIARDVERALVARPVDSGSAAHVARALNVSVRTLQRRLVESGTTFREVADEVRSGLAQGYLADERVSIAEVACLLGFSDQSSFNRAFHRWTGESPRKWRQGGGRRKGR